MNARSPCFTKYIYYSPGKTRSISETAEYDNWAVTAALCFPSPFKQFFKYFFLIAIQTLNYRKSARFMHSAMVYLISGKAHNIAKLWFINHNSNEPSVHNIGIGYWIRKSDLEIPFSPEAHWIILN